MGRLRVENHHSFLKGFPPGLERTAVKGEWKMEGLLMEREELVGELCARWLRHGQLFAALWTVAHQAPMLLEIFQARILE